MIRHCVSDVFLIFDCCFTDVSVFDHHAIRMSNIFEYMAAAYSHAPTRMPENDSFTQSLTWALIQLSQQKSGFSTHQLLTMILQAHDYSKDQTPVLSERGALSSRRLMLAPLSNASQASSAGEKEAEDYRIDIRFHFQGTPKRTDVTDLGARLNQAMSDSSSLQRIEWKGLSHVKSKSPFPTQNVEKSSTTGAAQIMALKWQNRTLRRKIDSLSLLSNLGRISTTLEGNQLVSFIKPIKTSRPRLKRSKFVTLVESLTLRLQNRAIKSQINQKAFSSDQQELSTDVGTYQLPSSLHEVTPALAIVVHLMAIKWQTYTLKSKAQSLSSSLKIQERLWLTKWDDICFMPISQKPMMATLTQLLISKHRILAFEHRIKPMSSIDLQDAIDSLENNRPSPKVHIERHPIPIGVQLIALKWQNRTLTRKLKSTSPPVTGLRMKYLSTFTAETGQKLRAGLFSLQNISKCINSSLIHFTSGNLAKASMISFGVGIALIPISQMMPWFAIWHIFLYLSLASCALSLARYALSIYSQLDFPVQKL